MRVVIDGCPPRLALSEEDIQPELDRRRPGQSDIVTPRKEEDTCQIPSGVFQGSTLGTPISIWVRNTDARPEGLQGDGNDIPTIPRRLYLSGEVWHSQLAGRWTRIGARNHRKGRSWCGCKEGLEDLFPRA